MERSIRPKVLKASESFIVHTTFKRGNMIGGDIRSFFILLIDLGGHYYVVKKLNNPHVPPYKQTIMLNDILGYFHTGDLLEALMEFRTLCDEHHCAVAEK